MSAQTAAEALIQVWEGRDFDPPTQVLNRVSKEKAATTLPELGYSLATYVLHTDFWQAHWLRRLKGEPSAIDYSADWRVAKASEWEEIRRSFLSNFQEAIEIARADPFKHGLSSDQQAVTILLQIAIHNAYHMGQFVLVKRALRKLSQHRAKA